MKDCMTLEASVSATSLTSREERFRMGREKSSGGPCADTDADADVDDAGGLLVSNGTVLLLVKVLLLVLLLVLVRM